MENNRWYNYDEDSEIAVIFVHGFFSSSSTCWLNKEFKTYWPELIRNEKRIPNLSIYMGGFYTEIDSGELYGIRQCAQELFDAIHRDAPDGLPAPVKKTKLLFLCHSLGGIVVRYMLESKSHSFLNHNIGLVLMASPSMGSDYADNFKSVINFYKNKLGKQLSKDNDILNDLDDRFKDFIDERHKGTFHGVEAVEHLGMFSLKWFPGFSPIVKKESAARYFKSKILPGCDHSSIVKPNNHDHPSHTFLVDFFRNKFTPEFKYTSSSGTPKESEDHKSVLFDIYDKSCEPYYYERPIDNQVNADFSVANFWIYGPSGSGKTSIIKRLLSSKKSTIIEMCFSQCESDNSRQSYISEMIETIHLQDGELSTIPEREFKNLAHLIVSKIKSVGPLSLYIDEVPTTEDSNSANELLKLIEELLVYIKQLAPANHLRIVVSSLQKPDLSACKNLSKLNGYLRIRECSLWNDDDLDGLKQIIIRELSPEITEENTPKTLVAQSKGSPRFLKTFFKTKLTQPEKSNDEIIILASHGFQS
jgi:Cdc6-like AAA superfamily ATPase